MLFAKASDLWVSHACQRGNCTKTYVQKPKLGCYSPLSLRIAANSRSETSFTYSMALS